MPLALVLCVSVPLLARRARQRVYERLAGCPLSSSQNAGVLLSEMAKAAP